MKEMQILFFILLSSSFVKGTPEPPFLYQNLGSNYEFDDEYNNEISRYNTLQSQNTNPPIKGYGVLGQYGAQCNDNFRSCDKSRHLECIDGKCKCENPSNRLYDPDIQQCVSLSGGPCGFIGFGKTSSNLESPDGSGICTKNAQCFHGICQCAWGYSSTTKKTCKLNYGQLCQPHQCNEDRGLACKTSVCKCRNSSSVYKFISARCVDPQGVTRTIGRAAVAGAGLALPAVAALG